MRDDDLFQQGITAYETGNRSTAALIFYTLTRQNPSDQLVWLWLADCVENRRDKRNFLQFAVALDPHSEAGKRAAQHLRQLNWLRLPALLTSRGFTLYLISMTSLFVEALAQRLSSLRSGYSTRQ